MLITGWRNHEFEFSGDIVRAKLRPLNCRAAAKIKRFLMCTPFVERQSYAMKMADAFYFQSIVPLIFPEHVKDIDLKIEGQPITIKQLAEEAVLNPLVSKIFAELLKISRRSLVPPKPLSRNAGR
jgi:hypothetical protein